MKEPWETMFNKLKSYKANHGHCNVPAHRDKLGRWVEKQRQLYRMHKLASDRKDALESVGFQWRLQQQLKPPREQISTAAFDRAFDEMVMRVVQYVEDNGHGWIPETYEEDRGLGIWAKNRRREKKKGALRRERVNDLEKAGFIWEFKDRWTQTKAVSK